MFKLENMQLILYTADPFVGVISFTQEIKSY